MSGAPSNPRMRFPDCPRCGRPVNQTFATTGVLAAPAPGGAGVPHLADAVPDGWAIVAGSPEHDLVALHPCGHALRGDEAHEFTAQGLVLAYRDLVIEITVEVPAALVEGRHLPAVISKRSVYSVAEVEAAAGRDPNPIASMLTRAAEAVATQIGQVPA